MTLLLLLCWTKAFVIFSRAEECLVPRPVATSFPSMASFERNGHFLDCRSLSFAPPISTISPKSFRELFFASILIVIRSVSRRVATSQKSQQQARFYPSFTLYLNFSHKEERSADRFLCPDTQTRQFSAATGQENNSLLCHRVLPRKLVYL